MLKRLVNGLIAISVLVLAFGYPASAWASSGDDDSTQRTRNTSPIWEGLCVGASLDLSKASQRSCARQAAAAEREDESFVDDEPNIGAGLCVGASLDLSKASQKKCVKQTQTSDDDDNNQDESVETSSKKDRHRDKETTAVTPPSQLSGTYAALGDSVAAGLGLDSPVGADGACGRTFDSYIYQVAEDRELQVVINKSCSGATLGDLFTEQGVSGPNPEAQLDGAFASGTPELITITAGANDIRWDDFLRKCYAGTCGTPTDERVASALLAALELKMQFLFQDIERRSNGSPPEVIMTGYYNPLSDSCAEIEPRLTLEEISWLSEKTAQLNQMLERTAGIGDIAEFAPVDFSGHDICSDDPWVQTLDDPAPFHPTFEGQQAIADAIS